MSANESTSTGRALDNPWYWLISGLVLTAIALLWLRIAGDTGDTVRLILLALGLLSSGVGVWRALRGDRRARGRLLEAAAREAAAELLVAGVTAFLGCWALYYGAERAGDWDSLRLLLAVVAVLALLAAPLVMAPRLVQKIVVSLVIVLHFGGILTAVVSAQPGPWVMAWVWSHFYRPYLEFMYLTNAYRFYSPEPGPASQLWMRLAYEDNKGNSYARWLKFPETDETGKHQYTLALRYQRRQSLVDNISNTILTTSPSPVVAQRREQQTPASVLRGVLGQPQPKVSLMIPYSSDPRFPEDQGTRIPQYAEPYPMAKELIQSFARHVAELPYPNHPEYRFVGVKIYRAQHRILSAPALAEGVDHRDLTTYLPYYLGEFNARGKLLDSEDPFLYWLVPIMREEPMNPKSAIKAYVFLHAGDKHDWIKTSTARK